MTFSKFIGLCTLPLLVLSGCCVVKPVEINNQLYKIKECGDAEEFRTKVMFAAIDADSPETVAEALANGVKVEFLNDQGLSPLMFAAQLGRPRVCGLLLDKGAGVDFRGAYGRTALMHAAKGGNVAAVELLLKRGADIHARDGNGDTALDHAFKDESLDVLRFMMESSDREISSRASLLLLGSHAIRKGYRVTPRTSLLMLFIVCDYKSDFVEKSISRKEEVEEADANGLTPLMLAARYANVEVVRLLLRKGATTGSRDNRGKTAYDYARMRGEDEIINLLRSES